MTGFQRPVNCTGPPKDDTRNEKSFVLVKRFVKRFFFFFFLIKRFCSGEALYSGQNEIIQAHVGLLIKTFKGIGYGEVITTDEFLVNEKNHAEYPGTSDHRFTTTELSECTATISSF